MHVISLTECFFLFSIETDLVMGRGEVGGGGCEGGSSSRIQETEGKKLFLSLLVFVWRILKCLPEGSRLNSLWSG